MHKPVSSYIPMSKWAPNMTKQIYPIAKCDGMSVASLWLHSVFLNAWQTLFAARNNQFAHVGFHVMVSILSTMSTGLTEGNMIDNNIVL